jgi:hypothetical protein
MAASAPQIPKIVIFTLATVSYAEDLIDCAVVPAPGAVQSVLTLDGVTHQDVSPVTWGLQIKCVQDWSSSRPGLAYALWAAQGTTVAFVFKNETGAESAALPKFTGSCTLVPIPYGGEGNAYAEAEVFLPITGALVLDATP